MADRRDQQPEATTRNIPGADVSISKLGTGGAPTFLPYGLSLSTDMAVMRPEQTLEFLAIDHIAIRVADVRRAEAFYHEFFEMDIVMRARRIGDEWEPISTDFDWHEALGAGFFPDLVYLRNGPLSLYLINAGRGAVMIEPRLAHIGLRVTPQTLTALRGVALIRAFSVVEDASHTFRFRDPYGLTWNLTDVGPALDGGTPR